MVPGMLLAMRTVQASYAGRRAAPTQIDFHVFTKDADTLTAWVQKHSGPCDRPASAPYYWVKTSNLTPTKVAGAEALSFDWGACTSSMLLHSTVFFMGPYIFELDWFTTDPTYASIAQETGQQMLASFRG
jgi:hypothetical protein